MELRAFIKEAAEGTLAHHVRTKREGTGYEPGRDSLPENLTP